MFRACPGNGAEISNRESPQFHLIPFPMNSRNRKFILIGGMFVLAVVGSTVWTKRRELFPHSADIQDAIRSARSESRHASGDAAEREKARRVNALYEATLAKHPGLQVTNGGEWDADKVATWMNEHADLIAEIMEIGLAPDQSVKGISLPQHGFFQARLPKEMVDLLLMRARLEAERGSPETSLQTLQATMGLANHFDRIETPTLLHVTVSSLIRGGAIRQFFENVLPALSGDELDLSAWQQNFGAADAPEELGRLLIGEWHMANRFMVMPDMVAGEEMWKQLPDPEMFLDRWADWAEAAARGCDRTDLAHLLDTLGGIHAETNGVSRQSIGLLELAESGPTSWSKGWVRSQIVRQLPNAAFAHLRGEPLPNEPITGKPFVWDEASQSIRFSEDERLKRFDLKPLVVKRQR